MTAHLIFTPPHSSLSGSHIRFLDCTIELSEAQTRPMEACLNRVQRIPRRKLERLTPHPPAYVAHACVNVDEISKLAAAGAIVARARCQTSGWMLTLCML